MRWEKDLGTAVWSKAGWLLICGPVLEESDLIVSTKSHFTKMWV